ncbi:hypothetical protein CCACVL1_21288 [Corchorus capsularis]|uniref:Uncharacterized protein n=1 Tax=Corchorus capsularis TaxID=210143 RepID=A0A1R3H737_COCAP|nr:hypothetical protein CCACVL1_21288 [Corchorus capsularis]
MALSSPEGISKAVGVTSNADLPP